MKNTVKIVKLKKQQSNCKGNMTGLTTKVKPPMGVGPIIGDRLNILDFWEYIVCEISIVKNE